MNECPKVKKVKGTKAKKTVKGWSTEEMKDEAGGLLEEDTEKMRTWRFVNQEEMDQCWKKLAERMEVEVLDKYKVEDSTRERLTEAEPLRWNGGVYEEAKKWDKKVVTRLLGKNFRLVQRIQPAASAKHAGGFGGRRRRDEAAEKNEDHEGHNEED